MYIQPNKIDDCLSVRTKLSLINVTRCNGICHFRVIQTKKQAAFCQISIIMGISSPGDHHSV